MGNTVGVEKESEDEDDRVLCTQGNGNLWTVSKFYDDEEDEFLSEFEHDYGDPRTTVCVDRSIEVLRQIRHPNIVKYLSSTSDLGKVYMLTECVVPAKLSLQKLSSVEAVVGIRDIGKALDFMLNRLKISHNNLHLGSVFVDERTHQWKLGGMEASNDLTKIDDKFLSSVSSVRVASAVPPEEKDPASFSGRAHPHASDMWGFGQLILEINDELGEDDPLPTELVEYAETALTNEDPSERPAIKELLLHPSGRTAFTDVVEFLSDFTLKNEEDKKLFCKKMLCAMTSFPEEAVCHRLLPVLLTPPVMGDPNMLPIWDTILIPKSDTEDCQVSGFFSQQCFKREVLSRIGELFRSRENHVRVILLKYFEFYAILFPVEELEEAILPEILIGLREEDDHLVAGTLRALATLVILLGSDVVMGTSRSSVFSDSLPRNTLDQSSFGTPPIRSVGEYRTFSTNSSFSQRGVSSPSEPSALALREEKRRKRKEEQEMRKQKRMKERELRSNTGIASNRTISFADDVNPEGEFPESGAGEWDFPTYDQSHSLPHKSTTNNRTGGNGDGEGGEGDGWEDFDEDGGWKDFDDGVGVSGGNGDGVIREGDGWDDDNVWEDFEENAQHSSWRDDALHEDSHQKYDGYQNGLVGNDHYHDQWDVDDDRTQGLQQFGLRTNSFTRTISTTSAQSSSVINSPNENWDKVSLSSYTSGALLKTDSEPSKKTNQLKTDKKIKKMNTKIKNKQAGFDSMESPNGIQNRNGSSLSSTPQSWEKKGSKSNKKTKTQSKQPIFEPEPDYFAGMEPMV